MQYNLFVVYFTYTYQSQLWHKHIYKCKPQTETGRLCCSGKNAFFNFWLRFFVTRRRTQFLLRWPHKRSAHPVMFKISVGRDLKIPTTSKFNSGLNGEKSTSKLNGPTSTPNWLFFKILKFSGPSLPSMTSFTLQPYFLSGVYYDNADCHILCTRCTQWLYTWILNPNSSKPNQTEW